MSLRARLLLTTVVLVAVGLVVANVATYRFLASFLGDRLDEQLVSAQGPAATALALEQRFDDHRRPPGLVLPPGTYADARDPFGRTFAGPIVFGFEEETRSPIDLPSRLPGSAELPDPAPWVLTAEGTGDSGDPSSFRVLTEGLRPGGGTLVVAIPLSEVDATLHRLLVVEGSVTVAVLVAVAVLALWLVRVGLRPLEGIGHTAGDIAAGDLSRRVEPADDRTEVGRLGLALNAMLAQIEVAFDERRASEERLRRFVADASHELRTPLTSIRGYAELFRRGADTRPEDLTKAMSRIEAEAARMGILVDDLLLLARLDQGRPLERKPVDLGPLVAEAVESARAIEPDRPIDLKVDGAASVLGDAGRLRQVVSNLLDNVRVHTGTGIPVRVKVEPNGEDVVVTVADDGPGLPPEVATRAFERFYRGDPARSRETGGAGLGLSIVAAIVQAHGGTVGVESSDGAGARFEVRLPSAGLSAEQDEGPARAND